MQIRLTVVDPLGPSPQRGRAASRDVLVTAPAGTELAAVASALAGAVTGETGAGREAGGASVVLYAGAERLDPRRSTLGEPPLVDGAVLSLGAPAAPEPHPELDDAPTQLHVVAGPDAGGVHLLHGGRITVGRSADADVPLDDPDVSRLHCVVTVGADGRVSVADLGSTNGTSLDGVRVTDRPVRVPAGGLLRIGESALRVTPCAGPGTRVRTVPDGEGCVRVAPGDGAGGSSDAGAGSVGAAAAHGREASPGAAGAPGGGRPPSAGAGARGGAAAPSTGAGRFGGESRSGGEDRFGGTTASPAGAGRAGGPGGGAAGPAGGPQHAYGAHGSAGWGSSGGGADAQEHRRGRSPVVPGQAGAPSVESRRGTASGGDTHAGRLGVNGPGGTSRGASGTPHAGTPHTGAPYNDASYNDAPYSDAPYTGTPDAGDTRADGRKHTPLRGTEAPQATRRRGLGAWARRLAGGRGEQPAGPEAYDRTAARPGGIPAAGVPRQPETWPDPAALLLTALGPGPRLWERGPGHPEALTVRLGTADRSAPDGSGLLPAVPVTTALREAGALGLAGPRPRLSGLARAVLAQLAALHSPDLLEIVLISADRARPVADRAAEWAWLGWLPHVRPGHGQDCRLLLAYDREQAAARAEELLRRVDDLAATGRTAAHPGPARDTDPATAPGPEGWPLPSGSPSRPPAHPDADAHPGGPGAPGHPSHPAHPGSPVPNPRPGTPGSPLPGTPGVSAPAAPSRPPGLPGADAHRGTPAGPGPAPHAGTGAPAHLSATRRPSWAREDAGPAGGGGFAGPFTVVVVDGDPGGTALRDSLARLAVAGPRAGIHVVCLAETEPAAPASTRSSGSPGSPVTGSASRTYEEACAVTPTFRHCGAVALLSGDVAATLQVLRVAPGGPVGPGTLATVDAVSAAWAERFARALAPLRPDGPSGEPYARVATPLPQSARLLDELGLARATPASLMARWADAADDTESPGGRARAVLGAGPRGPVTADLVADGPHLLVEGPACSGRTELLRTVVASLAAAERPDRLAVVLLDGRDGAGAGAGHGEGLRVCTDIPHVTTHLIANDPVRMREFAQSLTAELKRRAELLGRTDFARWHAGHEVSGRIVAQRAPAPSPGTGSGSGSGDIEAPPSSTLRLRPGAAARQRAGAVPPLPRLVVVVDDLDALVSPPLGSPGRPAAGSVIRALEAVAREGERLGVHLVAAAAAGGRTAETEPARLAALRVALDAPQPGPDQPAPGRGTLVCADGRAVGFQGGRVTGRIPRTATQRPTVVPLDWQRMGDPPARRPVRELGNGPTDLALLASAVERAARQVSAAEVPSLL
ncbi:FHA domain-containing protein [Streptomyces naphthomycinicus]|uniref:FHA domain-containing protein n=1 Tax=Streptomyces naphthomycinicus TaxID=2872625 RepID=UPI001CECF445|nr:FHA domain-containing protein [Streptomyces sp. TML10]